MLSKDEMIRQKTSRCRVDSKWTTSEVLHEGIAGLHPQHRLVQGPYLREGACSLEGSACSNAELSRKCESFNGREIHATIPYEEQIGPISGATTQRTIAVTSLEA
jgi:hypothetical protein